MGSAWGGVRVTGSSTSSRIYPLPWIEISKELIRIECAKLCPQVDVEIAFREGGAYCNRRHVWNGGEGFGRKLMAYLLG